MVALSQHEKLLTRTLKLCCISVINGFILKGEKTSGDPEVVYSSDSFAAQLLQHGSDPNAVEPESGMFIRHRDLQIAMYTITLLREHPTLPCMLSVRYCELRHEKTDLVGFQPGSTLAGLYNLRRGVPA